MLKYLKYAIFAGILALAACSGSDDSSSDPETASVEVETVSEQYRTHPSCIEAIELAEEALGVQVPRVLQAAIDMLDNPYSTAPIAEVEDVNAWLDSHVLDYRAAADECASYVR